MGHLSDINRSIMIFFSSIAPQLEFVNNLTLGVIFFSFQAQSLIFISFNDLELYLSYYAFYKSMSKGKGRDGLHISTAKLGRGEIVHNMGFCRKSLQILNVILFAHGEKMRRDYADIPYLK